jgi:hypothetical protein
MMMMLPLASLLYEVQIHWDHYAIKLLLSFIAFFCVNMTKTLKIKRLSNLKIKLTILNYRKIVNIIFTRTSHNNMKWMSKIIQLNSNTHNHVAWKQNNFWNFIKIAAKESKSWCRKKFLMLKRTSYLFNYLIMHLSSHMSLPFRFQ